LPPVGNVCRLGGPRRCPSETRQGEEGEEEVCSSQSRHSHGRQGMLKQGTLTQGEEG